MTTPAMRKHAHDSGDGETIYHCPFCGSGQVIARSDRTIECQFCHICFTVQVQPQFPAFPQTINGQPVQVPGMPGQIGQDPSMAGGMPPGQDPGADPNAPVDPSQMGADGSVPPADDPTQSDDDSDGEDKDSPPPWVSKTSAFVTDRGHVLSADDYARHLAIKHADNPREMAAMIKEARSGRQ